MRATSARPGRLRVTAQFRGALTYANVVSTACLFVLLGGSALAAASLTGADIVDGSLTGVDIRNETVRSADVTNASLTSVDVMDRSLRAIDFGSGQLPPGATGPSGAIGPAGPAGAPGTTGTQGETGAPGPPGPSGATGPMGAPGVDGSVGAVGPAGADGPQGPAGSSAVPVSSFTSLSTLNLPASGFDHFGMVTPAFVVPAGVNACMVTSTVQMHPPGTAANEVVYMRNAVSRNGGVAEDGQFGQYLVNDGTGQKQAPHTRTSRFGVAPGQSVAFGVYFGGLTGTWYNAPYQPTTSYVCF